MKIKIKAATTTSELTRLCELINEYSKEKETVEVPSLKELIHKKIPIRVAYLNDVIIGGFVTRFKKETKKPDEIFTKFFGMTNYIILENMVIIPKYNNMAIDFILIKDFIKIPFAKALYIKINKNNRKTIHIYKKNDFISIKKYKDNNGKKWLAMVYKE